MADTRESLMAQAELLRTRMELLAAQAQVMQYQHRDLGAQLGRLNAQMQALAAAEARAAAPPVDEVTQAQLDGIAKADRDQLPNIITKQARNDDGTPVLGSDGLPVLVRQDGSPLTVIERAILARSAELRKQAGG